MLLMFQASACYTRLKGVLGGWMKSILLQSERVGSIYLFHGVQNTTQVHQETDQNYGLIKSDVHWNIATLTAELVREFLRQQSLRDEDLMNCAAPTKTVTIGRDQYGLILSGRNANEE
jgi:hypothetical protein